MRIPRKEKKALKKLTENLKEKLKNSWIIKGTGRKFTVEEFKKRII